MVDEDDNAVDAAVEFGVDQDSLTFTGNDIEYTDSVQFLLNSRDTIMAGVKTWIWSTYNQFAILDIRNMNAQSTIRFNTSSGFNYAEIFFREFYETAPSVKTVEASLISPGRVLDEVITESLTLDSAVVLGRRYEQVYTFELPRENNESEIKTVLFAKKFGFIKIEGYDGRKIELIEIKSKKN